MINQNEDSQIKKPLHDRPEYSPADRSVRCTNLTSVFGVEISF